MKQGDMVELSDGRTGYYQGSANGKISVLVTSVEQHDTKNVKLYKEWKRVKPKGAL